MSVPAAAKGAAVVPYGQGTGSAVEVLSRKKDLVAAFEAARILVNAIRYSSEEHFSKIDKDFFIDPDDLAGNSFTVYMAFMIPSIFSVGAFYLASCAARQGYRYAKGTHNRYRDFSVKSAELKRNAKRLSDDPKKALLDFNRAAKVAFRMEEAAVIHRRCHLGLSKPDNLKKGLKLVIKAAAEAGMDKAAKQELINAYSDPQGKSFPSPGFFVEKLNQNLQEIHQNYKPLLA